MCQRIAQPFSCRNQSDLFRSAVQHGDGCRRRLSIRQTRSPKQARSFWCLFLKKARLFESEKLARAPRDSFSRPSPMPSAMLFPAVCSPAILLPLVVRNSRFLYPPFAPYHIQTKRPRTLTYHQIVHIHPQALVHTAPTQPNTRPLYRESLAPRQTIRAWTQASNDAAPPLLRAGPLYRESLAPRQTIRA